MKEKYRVTLEPEEREQLRRLLAEGKSDVRRLKHAQVLLAADESPGGPAQPDEPIAAAVGVARAAVERVRQRFVEEGLELAISPYRGATTRRPRTKPDGAQEARLAAVACSAPPGGRSRWASSMLAGRMAESAHVDSASRETVRRTPKKTCRGRT